MRAHVEHLQRADAVLLARFIQSMGVEPDEVARVVVEPGTITVDIRERDGHGTPATTARTLRTSYDDDQRFKWPGSITCPSCGGPAPRLTRTPGGGVDPMGFASWWCRCSECGWEGVDDQ